MLYSRSSRGKSFTPRHSRVNAGYPEGPDRWLFPDARIDRRRSQPVHADILVSEAGTEVRPTQPPHPLRIVDVPSGYPEDLETFGTPDTVDLIDILPVDVMPLASGTHATSYPDISVAASKSVDLSTSMSVEFNDRSREIRDTATSSFVDDAAGAYWRFRNPSLY